jgi:hypothetical protein
VPLPLPCDSSSSDHQSDEREREEIQMEATPPTAAAAAVTYPVAAVGDIAFLSAEAAECSMDEDIVWEDSYSDSNSFS